MTDPATPPDPSAAPAAAPAAATQGSQLTAHSSQPPPRPGPGAESDPLCTSGPATPPVRPTSNQQPATPSRRWFLAHLALPLGLLAAAYFLRDVLTPIVAALFLAYALSPAVDRLKKWGIPRGLGTFLVLLVTIGGLVGVALVVLPAVFGEFQRFVEKLPDLLQRLSTETIPAIERTLGVDLPNDLDTALALLAEKVRGTSPDALGPLASVAAHVLRGAAAFLSALFTVLLVPILTFFFLRDFPQLVAGVRKELPARYRPGVESYFTEVDRIMSAYLRGQLLVVLCLGALYALGLALLGLRLGVAIGLLAGVLAFIPYAGFAVGIALALLMALVTFEGVWMYVGIVAVFTGVQVLEGLVLTPQLIGRRLGMGMVGVLVAIIVFGATLGFVGVLLAVPLGAVFRVSFGRLMAWRAQVDAEGAGRGSERGGGEASGRAAERTGGPAEAQSTETSGAGKPAGGGS
ncbi:MAG: AI-2E family transporter [Deltaproteobacteria bacterium]|nr:AI-2E family transporter [Deltaproteobacteria bacterium]